MGAPGLEVCSEIGAIRRPQEGGLDVAGQHVLKILVSKHYLLRRCRPGQRVSQVLASGSQRHARQYCRKTGYRARLSESRRSSAAKKKRPIESPATTNQRCASSVRRSSASCRRAPHRSAWADHCQLSLGPGPHVARLGAAAQLRPQDWVSVLQQGCHGVRESERHVQPHLSGGLLVQLPELYSASQLLPYSNVNTSRACLHASRAQLRPPTMCTCNPDPAQYSSLHLLPCRLKRPDARGTPRRI